MKEEKRKAIPYKVDPDGCSTKYHTATTICNSAKEKGGMGVGKKANRKKLPCNKTCSFHRVVSFLRVCVCLVFFFLISFSRHRGGAEKKKSVYSSKDLRAYSARVKRREFKERKTCVNVV
jgi:hypothetical protein